MRVALFTTRSNNPANPSPGGSPLVVGIARGLAGLGHSVSEYEQGQGYDLIVVVNQVAHTTDYYYPEWPAGATPIAFVDSSENGYFTRLPDRAHLYANTFTEAAMGHDTKNRGEQERLKNFLSGLSFPYFLREMSIHVDYPASYHPIDYPLYALSEEPRLPDREEYLRRDLELFCWWGLSHPWREHITEALRGCHRKAEIGNRWGPEGNMQQSLYFERTRAAKASVSFDGYGSGSFRMTECLVRTCLLQGPLSIRTRAPLEDGVTCIAYNVDSDGEQFVGTNICEKLGGALADPEGSYAIYERGYAHCMAHLTETATAQYVLDVVNAHDWNVTTQLEAA